MMVTVKGWEGRERWRPRDMSTHATAVRPSNAQPASCSVLVTMEEPRELQDGLWEDLAAGPRAFCAADELGSVSPDLQVSGITGMMGLRLPRGCRGLRAAQSSTDCRRRRHLPLCHGVLAARCCLQCRPCFMLRGIRHALGIQHGYSPCPPPVPSCP